MKLIASTPLTQAELAELGISVVIHPKRLVPLRPHEITIRNVRRLVVANHRVRNRSPWDRCVEVFLGHVREGSRTYERLYDRLCSVYDRVMRRQLPA
jgi:hypothetical protein